MSTNDDDSGNTAVSDGDTAHSDKTDTSDDSDKTDSTDSGDSNSSDSGDTVTVKVNFETSCEASGGTLVNGRCVCNDEVCKEGIVCNFNEPHGCADNSFTQCPDKTPVCKNDDSTFVGKLTSCNSSNVYEEKSCEGDVSCKNDRQCGECLNYKHVCNNDPNTGLGAIYECQGGRQGKFVEECKNADDKKVSCRQQYAIRRDENGDPILDSDGYASYDIDEEASNQKGYTVYKLEPLNVCGECVDDEVKCENDLSDNAVMYRCVGGTWRQIYDYQDPASLSNSAASNNGVITVSGYRPGKGVDNNWKISLRSMSSDHAVSCNADGTMYGVCHNSVQYCINREFGKNGYIIRCHNGALEHYNDTTEHYIACNCVASNGNNGGCSTSRSCYSAQTATLGIEMCKPPSHSTSGYGDDSFVEDSGNFSCSQ